MESKIWDSESFEASFREGVIIYEPLLNSKGGFQYYQTMNIKPKRSVWYTKTRVEDREHQLKLEVFPETQSFLIKIYDPTGQRLYYWKSSPNQPHQYEQICNFVSEENSGSLGKMLSQVISLKRGLFGKKLAICNSHTMLNDR